MPEGISIADLDDDPYAWALTQAALLRGTGSLQRQHWRSECVEFHDRLIEACRPSIRGRVDLAGLWRRACRKAYASFDDHGEPRPALPVRCPVPLDALIDPEPDLDRLVAALSETQAL